MSVVPWEQAVQSFVRSGQDVITLYKATEQIPKGKCISIYGKPGTGKTELINRLIKNKYVIPMLYFNIDGGSWVLDNEGIYIVDVNDYKDFTTPLLRLANKKQIPFKSIAVDNGSSLQATNLINILGTQGRSIQATGGVSQQQWGISTAQMLNSFRILWTLAQIADVHVIITAWEDDRTNKVTNQTIKSGIGFSPSLARSFPGMMNLVGHISVKNDAPNYTRVINFATTPHSDAKFQRRATANELSIPMTIAYREQDVLGDILNCLIGGETWPIAKYKNLQAQATVDYATVTSEDSAQQNPVESAVAQRLSDEQRDGVSVS